MKHKNVTNEMIRDYVVEALLILMRAEDYNGITIGQITEKAGVNRSTYYRNFDTKEDIIRRFYARLLEKSLDSMDENDKASTRNYLKVHFSTFYERKNELLLIHKAGLSYLLLDVLNTVFIGNQRLETDFIKELSVYYHTGGIFNSFLLWFEKGMSISPDDFACICAEIYPSSEKPMLLAETPDQWF